MGARETLPNPGVNSLFLDVIEQLKKRDEIIAQFATDEISALKAQINDEILPQFMPKSGGEFTGPVAGLDLYAKPGRDNFVDIFLDNDNGEAVGVVQLSNDGNFAIGRLNTARDTWLSNLSFTREGGLFYNQKDLGRWAAIDPDSLMPKSGGDFTGDVAIVRDNVAWMMVKSANQDSLFAAGCNEGMIELWAQNYGWSAAKALNISSSLLYWNGNDLGRWAGIDPNNKVTRDLQLVSPTEGFMYGTNFDLKNPQGWDEWQNNAGGVAQQFSINNLAWRSLAFAIQRWTVWGSHHVGGMFLLPGEGQAGAVLKLRVGTASFDFSAWNNGITAGVFSAVSDARKKEKLFIIDSALSKIDAMSGYFYDWIDSGQHRAGLIAQEVETVLPMAVSENEGVKSLDYNAVVALLVNAVRELKAEVRALKGA